MASRIGRIEAAMVWFKERQDKVKETIDVALDKMAWEKRMVGVLLEKSALCEERLEKIEECLMQKGEVAAEGTSTRFTPAPNVSQLPKNNGMVIASGLGSTWSPVQLAPSPIPEVLIIPPTPQSAPLPSQPSLHHHHNRVFITTTTLSPSNTTS